MPGWYKYDSDTVCILCPKNSYCTGNNVVRMCLPLMISPLQSTHEDNCTCAKGNYIRQYSVGTKGWCRQCDIAYKCNGQQRIKCTQGLEICEFKGTYIPRSCYPGISAKDFDCEPHVHTNSDRLYTNIVRENHEGVYEVISPKIHTLLNETGNANGILRVGSDLQKLCRSNSIITVVPGNQGLESQNSYVFKCFEFDIKRGIDLISYIIQPPNKTIGSGGFIDRSSMIESDVLMDPLEHLVWNLCFSCNTANKVRDRTRTAKLSEIRECLYCNEDSGEYFTIIKVDEQLMFSRNTTETYYEYHALLPATNQMYWDANGLSPPFLRVTQYNAENYAEMVDIHIYSKDKVFVDHTHRIDTRFGPAFGNIEFVLQSPVWRYASMWYTFIPKNYPKNLYPKNILKFYSKKFILKFLFQTNLSMWYTFIPKNHPKNLYPKNILLSVQVPIYHYGSM
jgi:hypothetical protein